MYSQQLKYFIFTNPLPLEFFTATWSDGIDLWKYDKESGGYNPTNLIEYSKSGKHRRGEMNKDGIYIAPGYYDPNVKIYDMKYYNYPDNKIQLIRNFSHTDHVRECFLRNSVTALCCGTDGYIKTYNLTDPYSIPDPTIFKKTTTLSPIISCMQTQDKKHIITVGYSMLYILDADNGTLKNTQNFTSNGGRYTWQIAEIKPNILITTNENTASLHDIRDPHNLSHPIKLHDIGFYSSVLSLNNNPGDFAIGGRSSRTNLGFVYILHLEEDNQTIITLKSIDNIQGTALIILTIKELKRGTILFGGGYATSKKVMCLWNYFVLPSQEPLCWDDQTASNIWDILEIPY